VASPRDRFLTVYGRRPVLEALGDDRLTVDKVLVSQRAHGPEVGEIERLAARRGVTCRRVPPADVTRLSRNGRQDQGVAADVVAPRMRSLDELDRPAGPVLVLDGITNPQNVGMILRTAVAAGIAAVVVPTAGVADLGPLVVKASAGLAFQAPIVRARSAADAVDALRRSHGYRIVGLAAQGGRSLYDDDALPERAAYVLGGEHAGLTVEVDELVTIPLAPGVESLNVAVAAGVLCFELARPR
jgi:23S rRNA (guanosine2251-2'-O)-methyltransferase